MNRKEMKEYLLDSILDEIEKTANYSSLENCPCADFIIDEFVQNVFRVVNDKKGKKRWQR